MLQTGQDQYIFHKLRKQKRFSETTDVMYLIRMHFLHVAVLLFNKHAAFTLIESVTNINNPKEALHELLER